MQSKTKGFVSRNARKTPSPGGMKDTRSNRNSPLRMISRPPATQRPRSRGSRPRLAEGDDFLSIQSARDGDDALSLQGSELDVVKDFVQNQIQQQDNEADQGKGRKSPGANRSTLSRKGSFGGGRAVHATPVKDLDQSSDHLSDTTEVEKYMTSDAGDEFSDAIIKMALQMDKTDIDKTISVLLHMRKLSGDTPVTTQGNTRHPVVTVQSYNTHRSKSGPPGLSPNRPPYRYPMQGGGHTIKKDMESPLAVGESDNEEEEEEVRRHDKYIFIPQYSTFCPESEVSTNNSGSRGSTPNYSHKRSPTPVGHGINEHCPGVERHVNLFDNQIPSDYVVSGMSHITVTEFSRPLFSRDVSASSANSDFHSPSCRNYSDDVISVGSSNSSFTALTAGSAGNFSISNRNR